MELTPKEKAKELIEDFKYTNKFVNPNWAIENAKNCALLCVNKKLELINLINNDGADDYYEEILQVKEELEKM